MRGNTRAAERARAGSASGRRAVRRRCARSPHRIGQAREGRRFRSAPSECARATSRAVRSRAVSRVTTTMSRDSTGRQRSPAAHCRSPPQRKSPTEGIAAPGRGGSRTGWTLRNISPFHKREARPPETQAAGLRRMPSLAIARCRHDGDERKQARTPPRWTQTTELRHSPTFRNTFSTALSTTVAEVNVSDFAS